jgi:uncharacterized protein YdhG (YjbR/CyaY superfamily)
MSVDEYLKNITPEQRAEFDRVQKILNEFEPSVEQVISYGIPTFKYKGKYLLYFGAFKNHMSLFPGSGFIDDMKDELSEFKVAKGTIQFNESKPVPEEVILKILKRRRDEIDKR